MTWERTPDSEGGNRFRVYKDDDVPYGEGPRDVHVLRVEDGFVVEVNGLEEARPDTTEGLLLVLENYGVIGGD